MIARALLLTGLVLGACAPPAERGASERAATPPAASSAAESTTAVRQTEPSREPQDSVRGVVESVGSEPLTQLILRQPDGSTCAVHAAPTVVPASVAGLEVTLWGTRTTAAPPMLPGATCAISALRYAVRAADGVPTVDGVLRADGARFSIELASGEKRALRDVPAVLRGRVGARIFWAGPLDRAPASYGVLQEARK